MASLAARVAALEAHWQPAWCPHQPPVVTVDGVCQTPARPSCPCGRPVVHIAVAYVDAA